MQSMQPKLIERKVYPRRPPSAGDVLNAILPALEADGFAIVDGTAGDDGVVVCRDGVNFHIGFDAFPAPFPIRGGSPEADDDATVEIPYDAESWRMDDGVYDADECDATSAAEITFREMIQSFDADELE
jgi:hypothetical protein